MIEPFRGRGPSSEGNRHPIRKPMGLLSSRFASPGLSDNLVLIFANRRGSQNPLFSAILGVSCGFANIHSLTVSTRPRPYDL